MTLVKANNKAPKALFDFLVYYYYNTGTLFTNECFFVMSDFQSQKIKEVKQNIESSHSNITHPTENHAYLDSKKAKRRKNRRSCCFVFLIIIFAVIGSFLSAGNSSFLGGVKNSYLVRQITNIIYPSKQQISGEAEDRINFLLLGIGGPGHDGPYLTDTIIIGSFKPSTKEAALFSLPRDMVVPYNGSYVKINEVYSIGKKDNDQGGELAKKVIGETFDIPLHYYAVVDFDGFIKMIDELGGVTVTVDRAFSDYQFPTADYKVQTVSFQAGEQKMDGLSALRFARSRHGNNGEGSDFARIKRQQKILLAAKEKISSFNTWINPKKITDLFSLLNQYTTTDLEPWEAVKMIHLTKGANSHNVITKSIDDGPGSYLKAGYAQNGAFILQPISGNFDAINKLIKEIFTYIQVPQEKAKIVVLNGTPISGLALQAVSHLQQMGYNVLKYGNDQSTDKITTVVYDFTKNKNYTKKSLETIFQTTAQNNIPLEFNPAVIAEKMNLKDQDGQWEKLDFLVILGQDQQIDTSKQLVPTIDPSLLSSSTASSTSSSTPTSTTSLKKDAIIN